MKYFSLFSGIGGFELGIQQAYEENKNNQHKIQAKSSNVGHQSVNRGNNVQIPSCIGYSEIDKYAIQIYEKHFNHKNYGDTTKIIAEELPDFDLLVAGFPCQSFSIAGKRGGFKDTRGTLFFDIARIAGIKRPPLLLLENVKGLLNHDKGNTFATIISTLDELGYDCQWGVLNSKDYGVPQNRERVFIVGHFREKPRPKVFPVGSEYQKVNNLQQKTGKKQEGIQGEVSEADRDSISIKSRGSGSRRLNPTVRVYKTGHSKLHKPSQISQTLEAGSNFGGMTNNLPYIALTERRTEEAKKLRRMGVVKDTRNLKKLAPREDDLANTITSVAEDKNRYLTDGMKIRRLTPTECERLQGFPDGWTEGVSDTQRYKTLGNAVTVNVVRVIMDNLKSGLK